MAVDSSMDCGATGANSSGPGTAIGNDTDIGTDTVPLATDTEVVVLLTWLETYGTATWKTPKAVHNKTNASQIMLSS